MTRTERRKNTGVFLPLGLRGAIERLAKRDKVTLSEEMRQLLAKAVSHELLRDDE